MINVTLEMLGSFSQQLILSWLHTQPKLVQYQHCPLMNGYNNGFVAVFINS